VLMLTSPGLTTAAALKGLGLRVPHLTKGQVVAFHGSLAVPTSSSMHSYLKLSRRDILLRYMPLSDADARFAAVPAPSGSDQVVRKLEAASSWLGRGWNQFIVVTSVDLIS
jgi:hypothetical protein